MAVASTGAGALQALPSVDVESTIRDCPVTGSRCAHAMWTPAREVAIVGSALVRNSFTVVAWSKGAIVATSLMFLLGNVLPKSVDLAMTIPSGWLELANRRHVT